MTTNFIVEGPAYVAKRLIGVFFSVINGMMSFIVGRDLASHLEHGVRGGQWRGSPVNKS